MISIVVLCLGVLMAQFVVRNLEEEVKVRLKRRAQRHGRSMEEEIRHILRNAAKESGRSVTKLGSQMAARFRGGGLLKELPELSGQVARAAGFKS